VPPVPPGPPLPTGPSPSTAPIESAVLGAVAAGGVLGAVARYAVASAFPSDPAGFAWATFAINVSGCFLIGVLMVAVERSVAGHRLVRPFLGVGVLGGYTTFSAFALDAVLALDAGAIGTALAYVVGTLLAALAAVWAGSALTRRVVGQGKPERA
jgi:fluoride exporter